MASDDTRHYSRDEIAAMKRSGEVRATPATGKTNTPRKPLRPMSDDEVMAAALADPDAQPVAPEDFKRMKRIPRVKIIRRALGLTQEQFAARFDIPLGTLRDWEQGAAEPDAATRAYLKVIGRIPAAVAEALHSAP